MNIFTRAVAISLISIHLLPAVDYTIERKAKTTDYAPARIGAMLRLNHHMRKPSDAMKPPFEIGGIAVPKKFSSK